MGDAGDDEEACHPLGEAGRGEAWGRKGEPWRGAGRQEVGGEEVEEEGETGLSPRGSPDASSPLWTPAPPVDTWPQILLTCPCKGKS